MNELEITPRELKERLDRGEKVLLVDVREPHEYAICHIEGATLLPMGYIPANLQKLDVDDDVICYCHHGMRSLDVANWLRAEGVKSAKSMAGGSPATIPAILFAYSEEENSRVAIALDFKPASVRFLPSSNKITSPGFRNPIFMTRLASSKIPSIPITGVG